MPPAMSLLNNSSDTVKLARELRWLRLIFSRSIKYLLFILKT